MWTRRQLLNTGSVGACGLTLGCDPDRPQPSAVLQGELLGLERAQRGHRLWTESPPLPAKSPRSVDVLIVGAGVAGLTAAWRLREAGHSGVIEIVELADRVGGTATWGDGARGRFALGAHYITMPNPENLPMRRFLHAMGAIESFDGASPEVPFAGPARYRTADLCLAPQERLHVGGAWAEGLWPETASPEDDDQKAIFDNAVAELSVARGQDGRHAFSIPVALASRDPQLRALADISFADWLSQRGITSPTVLWWLEYGCRDDYGTTLDTTSAWAGLHYHCARRPDPADDRDLGTHVLTWAEGNGRLVQELVRLGGQTPRTGHLVRSVEPDTGLCVVEDASGSAEVVRAQHIILAVPTPVRAKLLSRTLSPSPTTAPWRVAALQLRDSPEGRGVRIAWDSVTFGASDLGYISSAHQAGNFGGPTVLTWYQPLTGEPAQARGQLYSATWASEAELVLGALESAHPDLRGLLERIDIWHWGHGTVRPTVGLHAPGVLDPLAQPIGCCIAAHTDLSGLSLFEEALWHGVSAAEWVLGREGHDVSTWLA